MKTLNEVINPVYYSLINRPDQNSKEQATTLSNLATLHLLVPSFYSGNRVYFLHNNKVNSGIIEGFEITQTRDIQTIMYCFQDQDFNKIEEDLFETREALIESLK